MDDDIMSNDDMETTESDEEEMDLDAQEGEDSMDEDDDEGDDE
jgi:hypothetical protein